MVRIILRVIAAIVLASAGVALTIYADADDSPGGMLIGLLVVAGAIVLVARTGRAER